ncbi:hypothetical protein PQZ07_00535 [bacterium]|nr:hypothetical protein [bacterium]
MKTLLKIGVVLPMVFFASHASAIDYDYLQNDFIVKKGDTNLRYRQFFGKDQGHLQLEKKVGDISYAYRVTQKDGELAENRIRVTHKGGDWHGFFVKPRFEYRMLENNEDYLRIIPIVGYKTGYKKLSVYALAAPMIAVYGKPEGENGKMYTTQYDAGFDYKLTRGITTGLYVRRKTDDSNWRKKSEFISTKITFNF